MDKYKQEYNKLLERYYNGCKYIESHPDEWDKYINVLIEMVNKLEEILNIIKSQNKNITNDEILNGFSV